MINGEAMDLSTHARHLKYAALACSHKCGTVFDPIWTFKEAALHVRAISCMGRVLMISLRAVWLSDLPKTAKAGKLPAWWWEVMITMNKGKFMSGDLEVAMEILLPDTNWKKAKVFTQVRKDRRRGFVKIGPKLESLKLPKGL